MNTYEISELKPNTYFNKPLMLDKSFLLVMPPSPLTGEQIRALKNEISHRSIQKEKSV